MADHPRRAVFLDTEVFAASCFDFGSRAFEELAKLVQAGAVRLVTTRVTEEEVKANIASSVLKATTALKHFRADASVLRNFDGLPFKSVMVRIDARAVANEITAKFDAFCNRTKTEPLDFSGVDAEEVFQSYFRGIPPFGSGAKKAEFPDAFSIAILREWANKNGREVHIISADPDWLAACQERPFKHYEKLADFLDSVAREFESELYAYAEQVFKENKRTIEKAIVQAIADASYYIRDEEGEVNEVTVDTIDFDLPSVIDISGDYAAYEVGVEANLEADITYGHPTFAHYDREDGRSYLVDHIHQVIRRTLNIDVEIGVILDEEDESAFDVGYVSVGHKSFGISPHSRAVK